MIGTYRVYRSGLLVAEQNNLITDQGRRHILRYLAGQEPALAGAIAVGAGQVEPVGADLHLTYEFERSTIYLISPSYIDKRIIFKSTLSRQTVGTIYELGLYSNSFNSFNTGSFVSFDSITEGWSDGTFESGNQRIGRDALRLTASTSGSKTSSLISSGLDLSSYANNDKLILAFYCLDGNTSSIRIRFKGSDSSSYLEMSVVNPVQGYNVRSITKSSLTKIGNIDFAKITSVEVSVNAKATGPAAVDFDGMRIESYSQDIENILISRATLLNPVVKSDTEEMDIEYSLDVSL